MRNLKVWLQSFVLLTLIIGSGIYIGYAVVMQNNADPEPRIQMGAKIIYIIPHTHLDPYWLDPWSTESERWSTNVRNALDLMKRNPDMTYVLDQVVAIKYFWEHYPEYRSVLRQYIQEGRIEIVQGFVSEPEMNLVGENALIQDAQVGIQWVKDQLGANINITVGWQIDVFGFGAGTPTFYQNLGLKYVFMNRLPIHIPEGLFEWTARDNSSIIGYRMPHYGNAYGNQGFNTVTSFQTMNDFYIKMYEWIDPKFTPERLTINPMNLSDARGDFIVFYGDDFTNPNWELPGWIDAWNAQEAEKTGYVIKFGTPSQFFDRQEDLIQQGGRIFNILPQGTDLNPFFSGYYTSRTLFKEYTRFFEDQLLGDETFAAIGAQILTNFSYPEEEFRRIWYKLATTHHHDSLTGTSPNLVYLENLKLFTQELSALSSLRSQIFSPFEAAINTAADNTALLSGAGAGSYIPWVIYNPLSWNRTEMVTINITIGTDIETVPSDFECIDPLSGQTLATQWATTADPNLLQLSFIPTIPSMGYKVYWIHALTSIKADTTSLTQSVDTDKFSLENNLYRVIFSNNSLSILDKTLNWEVLNQSGNPWQLIAEYDKGDVYGYGLAGLYRNITLLTPKIELNENGPVSAACKIIYESDIGTYNRTIRLYDGLPKVDFNEQVYFAPANSSALEVRWNFNLTNPSYRFQVPFAESTHSKSEIVPALYYTTVANATHGITIYNSRIHAYRPTPSTPGRLDQFLVRYHDYQRDQAQYDWWGTAFRESYDNGSFSFQYGLTTYAAQDALTSINAIQDAYAFNFKPVVIKGTFHSGNLAPEKSFYQVNTSSVMVLGLRKAWNENAWTLLLQNLVNDSTTFNIQSAFSYEKVQQIDFLNQPVSDLTSTIIDGTLKPYTWRCYRLENQTLDRNAPKVIEWYLSESTFSNTIHFRAAVNDAEGSSIQRVWIQYCFNETFENQNWTSIVMKKTGTYGFEGDFDLQTVYPNTRLFYFRIAVEDSQGNIGYSVSQMVVRSPYISTAELWISLGIFSMVMIGILYYLMVKRFSKSWVENRHPIQHLHIWAFQGSYSRKNWNQDWLFVISPMFALGMWIDAWLVWHGFFGFPTVQSLNPGYDVPGSGSWSPWDQTIQNNLFDIFTIDFFLFTIVIGLLSIIFPFCFQRTNLQAKHVLFILLGILLAPLISYIVLPLIFLIGGAPLSYYTQLADFVPFLYDRYNVERLHLYYWYFLPILISLIFALPISLLMEKVWDGVSKWKSLRNAKNVIASQNSKEGIH